MKACSNLVSASLVVLFISSLATAGPLTAPTFSSNLVFDLNAANVGSLSLTGTTVHSWSDQVGGVAFTPSLTVVGGPANGVHNFQSPTYNATGSPNGKPSIDFNGSNQALGTAANTIASTALPQGNSDRTVIMVASYQTVGTHNNIFGGFEYGGNTTAPIGGSAYHQQTAFSVAVISSTAGTPAANTLTTDTWANGAPLVNVVVNSGTWLAQYGNYSSSSNLVSTFAFENGDNPTSAPRTGGTAGFTLNTGSTGATLGTELSGVGNYAAVNISEVLVYNSLLTPTQMQAVDAYVNQQWFQAATVPEPGSVVLLGTAIGGLALAQVRRRKAIATRAK